MTEQGNIESFHRHHTVTNGWVAVGYHFVITNGNGGPDGLIQRGRPLWKKGAHCGKHNKHSIGICLVGDFSHPDSGPTHKQRKQLYWLIEAIWAITGPIKVVYHRDLCNTSCPGNGGVIALQNIKDSFNRRLEDVNTA